MDLLEMVRAAYAYVPKDEPRCRVFCATNDEGLYELVGDEWIYVGNEWSN